jgi:hypothetical protein
MGELEGTEQYDGVVEYLRASINHLVTTQFRSKGSKRMIDPGTVSSRLAEVLRTALSSDREQDLERIMTKYFQLKAEKQCLEAEHFDFQRQTERDSARFLEENAQLEEEYHRLEQEMKTTKSRSDAREEADQIQLFRKKGELQMLPTTELQG